MCVEIVQELLRIGLGSFEDKRKILKAVKWSECKMTSNRAKEDDEQVQPDTTKNVCQNGEDLRNTLINEVILTLF